MLSLGNGAKWLLKEAKLWHWLRTPEWKLATYTAPKLGSIMHKHSNTAIVFSSWLRSFFVLLSIS